MHAEIDQSEMDIKSEESPIFLPPAGDNLEAWRDVPYKQESWIGLLTYWVKELRWRKSFWGGRRR